MHPITKIDDFLKLRGMSESRLGVLACDNARAVPRVRNGTGSVATLLAILAYIDRRLGRTHEVAYPTPWAYEAACKALRHWREEAQRLGKLAGQKPRQMKRTRRKAA